MRINFPGFGVSPSGLTNNSYTDDRIGFWGTVQDVHAENNTVDVLMDIGILLPDVPVGCFDYVKENKIKNITFYSGKVDLPARESYVFCLMPNRTVTSAFVLCSGIPYGNSFSDKFFSHNSKESQQIEVTEKKTDQAGWTIEKRKDNGNVKLYSVDKNIEFHCYLEDDPDNSQDKKGVEMKAYGIKVFIGSDGKIELNSNETITIKSTKSVKVQGAAGTLEVK